MQHLLAHWVSTLPSVLLISIKINSLSLLLASSQPEIRFQLDPVLSLINCDSMLRNHDIMMIVSRPLGLSTCLKFIRLNSTVNQMHSPNSDTCQPTIRQALHLEESGCICPGPIGDDACASDGRALQTRRGTGGTQGFKAGGIQLSHSERLSSSRCCKGGIVGYSGTLRPTRRCAQELGSGTSSPPLLLPMRMALTRLCMRCVCINRDG